MTNRIPIKNVYGRILGYVETDSVTGNKTVYNFYNKILGKYKSSENTTRDFQGRIVGIGDLSTALIYADFEKSSKV